MNPINIMQCGTLDIPVELRSRLTADYASIMSFTRSSSSSSSSTSSLESPSSPTPTPPPPPQRYAVLSYEQVKRLDALMDLVVPIHGRGNFPTLEVKLKDLVKEVRAKLERDSVHVRDIRLNGGAACHVLNEASATADAARNGQQQPSYNDLDLIFAVDLATPRDYDRVKTAVLECLLDFLPAGVSKHRISSCSLKEAYVYKMVKVTAEGDRWSLISLGNARGLKVELKFVDAMRRQFEFSVDSFQIILDSLLVFYECAAMPMSDNFYPTVAGESVYGDFRESLRHLRKKLIATRNPEEIRGGGLLKYCNLLAHGYLPLKTEEIKTLERYMCSRFFIDFGDLGAQQQKLELYLVNHFYGEEHLVPSYLVILHQVVDESTVCLMGHERRQTLSLIEELACQSYFHEQHRLLRGNQQHQQQHQQQHYDFHVVYGNNNGGYYYTPYVPPAAPHHHHHHHQQQQHHHHHYSCAGYSWMPCA